MAFPHKHRGRGGKFQKFDEQLEEGGRNPALELPPPPTESDADEQLGVTGSVLYGGFLKEDEKDGELKGVRKYKTYSDIFANVAIVGAAVRAFLNYVGDATWKAEPADDSDEALEFAERVEDMLEDMKRPLHRIVRRLSMFRFYGWAAGEWVLRRDEESGDLVLDDVAPISQRTVEEWYTSPTGEVDGFVQVSPQSGARIPIPREKLVYVVDDACSDSPEGLGLFRHVVDSCRRLQKLLQLEAFGYEGDLRGIPVGKAPLVELAAAVRSKKITKAQADEMLQGLEDFVRSHVKNPGLGLILDSTPHKSTGQDRTPSATPQWALDLLDGGTYSLAEVHEAIMREVRSIARVFNVEHMLLGENASGTRSLSDNKVTAFAQFVDSTLKEVRIQLQKDLLGPLWELNGWDEELKPKLKVESVVFRDAGQMAEVMRNLATAGVQVDRQDEAVQELFDLMGLTRLKPLSEIDGDLLLSAQDQHDQQMEQLDAQGAQQAALLDQEGKQTLDQIAAKPKPAGKPAPFGKRMPPMITGESQADYVSRFMGNAVMRAEYPDEAQRAAVANHTYESRRRRRKRSN